MTVRRRGKAAALGLAAALVCALATALLHRLFVVTAAGQAVDQALYLKALRLPTTATVAADLLLGLFTVPVVLLAAAVPPAIALLRRAPWHAVAAIALVVGANLTTQLLKDHVFERPDLLSLGAPNSLPSGHTTLAASVALGLVLIAPPALRIPAAVLGLAASLVVGAATVVAGWHRPSDVAAALLVTLGWTGLLLAVVVLRPRPRLPHLVEATVRRA